ncbi:hypothetical protein FB451DRAFT_1302840 [Mycena latifolia]|nr:hypothetical protein FB451DRAFT_1302840 [Mycena latifolia]
MPTISLDGACLLGGMLNSMGYGILTVMTGFTLKSLLANKQLRYPSRLLLSVLSLIWILSTAHWIINVYRAYQAFIKVPEGAAHFYSTLSMPSDTARNVVYCMLTVVADTFAIYRAYLVWNRKWYMVTVPVIMLGGAVVTACGAIYNFTKGDALFDTTILPWATSWFVMTFSTNVVCTCLIGYRIIQSQRSIQKLIEVTNDRLWNTLIIIVESAAIYSSVLIVLISCYLLDSNAQYIVLDMSISTIGIAFTTIILRVSLGISSETRYNGARVAETMKPPVKRGEYAVNVSRLMEVNRGTYSDSGSHLVEGEEVDKNSFTEDPKSRLDHV